MGEQDILEIGMTRVRLVEVRYNVADSNCDWYITGNVVGIDSNYEITDEVIKDYNAEDHGCEQYFPKYNIGKEIDIPEMCILNKNYHNYYREFNNGLEKLRRNKFRKESTKSRTVRLLNRILEDNDISEYDKDFLNGIFRMYK